MTSLVGIPAYVGPSGAKAPESVETEVTESFDGIRPDSIFIREIVRAIRKQNYGALTSIAGARTAENVIAHCSRLEPTQRQAFLALVQVELANALTLAAKRRQSMELVITRTIQQLLSRKSSNWHR